MWWSAERGLSRCFPASRRPKGVCGRILETFLDSSWFVRALVTVCPYLCGIVTLSKGQNASHRRRQGKLLRKMDGSEPAKPAAMDTPKRKDGDYLPRLGRRIPSACARDNDFRGACRVPLSDRAAFAKQRRPLMRLKDRNAPRLGFFRKRPDVTLRCLNEGETWDTLGA